MSEQTVMTVEQKMARSIETWRKCDPVLMATQSQAALTFAFRDMKRDILVLADEVERLRIYSGSTQAFTRAENIALKQERDELRLRVAELEKRNGDLLLSQFDNIGSGNKAVRRIKAAVVMMLAREADFKASAIADQTSAKYWETFSEWLEERANQIEGATNG